MHAATRRLASIFEAKASRVVVYGGVCVFVERRGVHIEAHVSGGRVADMNWRAGNSRFIVANSMQIETRTHPMQGIFFPSFKCGGHIVRASVVRLSEPLWTRAFDDMCEWRGVGVSRNAARVPFVSNMRSQTSKIIASPTYFEGNQNSPFCCRVW